MSDDRGPRGVPGGDLKLADFADVHLGLTAYIIGKGPSLDRLNEIRSDLNADGSIVMALNEAIHKVEEQLLDVPVYVVQQDCHLEKDCVPKDPAVVHFMNSWQYTPTNIRNKRVQKSSFNPNAVLYDFPETDFSAVAALKIAATMGIKKVVFVAFDSWVDEKIGQYAKCIGKDSGVAGDPARHSVNGCWIRQCAKEMFKIVEAKLPDVVV